MFINFVCVCERVLEHSGHDNFPSLGYTLGLAPWQILDHENVLYSVICAHICEKDIPNLSCSGTQRKNTHAHT